jgi:phage repressor protein C with HTH and peptisase S24 domain
MTELSQRFAKAISKKGLKNADISKKYNISRQLVNNFFTIQKTLTEKMKDVCDGENINLHWLLTEKGEMFINNPKINSTNTTQTIKGNGNSTINGNANTIQREYTSQNNEFKNKLVEIPYLEDVYASAGGGAINYDDAPKPMAFSSDFLKIHLGISSFKDLHIINAIGNSMEPTIQEGEFLFVNPFVNEFNQIKDGGIYVINCNNSVFVKRINHNPITGAVILMSDNNKIPDIQINGQEFESCVIIGRVVGHFSSL